MCWWTTFEMPLHWSCVRKSQWSTLQECLNTRHWETLVWRVWEENFMRPDRERIFFFTFFSHWTVTIINQKTKRRVWWMFVINCTLQQSLKCCCDAEINPVLSYSKLNKDCCCIDMQWNGRSNRSFFCSVTYCKWWDLVQSIGF